MDKRTTNPPKSASLTGLRPSPSDDNRLQQAASMLAQMPGESLTTLHRFAERKDLASIIA